MTIIAKKLMGGGKTLSFLLSAFFVCSAHAAWLWKGGSSNNDWSNEDNWWSKSVASGTLAGYSGYYFWDKSVGENLGPIAGYAVNVDSAQSLSDHFFINSTSAANPIVITASAGEVGITNSKNLNIGWGNSNTSYGDGHLKIVRGTHKFSYVQLGREKANPDTSGTLILAGENGTLNFTATSDLKVYKGKVSVSKATLNIDGSASLGNLKSGCQAEFVLNSGTVNFKSKVCIGGDGGTGTFTMNGGKLFCKRTDDNKDGSLSVGYGATTAISYFHHNGGVTEVAGNLDISRDGSAEFNMNGGMLTVARKTVFGSHNIATDESCCLNFNGGVFASPYLSFHAGNGFANIRFNGGVFKVTESGAIFRGDGDYQDVKNLVNKIKVAVTSEGGTIDAQGKDIVIPLDISEDSSSLGGGSMAFVGGGTVTLGGRVGWTGGTVIAAGTIVKVDSAEKKNALFGNGRITVIPSHTGDFTVVTITGEDEFDERDLEKIGVAKGYASFRLSNDNRSIEMTAYGEINATTPILVFPDATLDDLSTHTLRARMKGTGISDAGTELTFFNKQEIEDCFSYQLQTVDGNDTKAVTVEFTQRQDGVYAQFKSQNFKSNCNSFGTTITENQGTHGYVPYDFMLVEPVSKSINVNFYYNDDAKLDTSSQVCYGAGDYAVPYSKWVNVKAASGTTPLSDDVSVEVSVTRGAYSCEKLNSQKDLRHGYIDENDSNKTPTVKILNIPYEYYRVVVYAATDVKDGKFGYVTINGTNYRGEKDATVTGTDDWGSAGPEKSAKGLREGVNYLVSPVLSDPTATVVGHRIGANVRGCIAAIQIVEYCPKTYTATIDEGGELSLADLFWDKELPRLLTPENALVVNINEDTTLTVESELELAAIYFNVAEGKTLTLSGAPIAAKWIKVSGVGQVVTSNSIQFLGTVKGDGTIVYDGCKPIGATFTDTAWKGTLWVKNIESTSEMRKDWALQNYGNAGSTLRFSNANIYFPSSTGTSFAGTVDIYGEGLNICDGYSGSIATIDHLTGSGNFVVSGGSNSSSGNGITIKDVSRFTGLFNITKAKVIIGNSTDTSPDGILQIDSNYTVNISENKIWTAAGGVILNGTLSLSDGSVAPAVASGTGTIRVDSGRGTIVGISATAAPKLVTAEDATLAVSNENLTEMTLSGLDNAGVINLTRTSLERFVVNLSSEEKNIESGEILWPTTFKRFVVVPVDGSIRSFAGYDVLEETLPEGAAYYVQVSATNEEFGKGRVAIENASDGVNVCVLQPDGTFGYVASQGGAVQFLSTVQIAGAATVFDYTYTNTTEWAYRAPGWNVGWDADSKPMTFNNELADETTGIYIKHHPWYTNIGPQIKNLDDFTLVVVGSMSSSKNTQFIHLGSSVSDTKTGLLITTTENEDEVLIAKNTGKTVDAINGVTASVPNAAKARHAYVIKKSGSLFEVWVDGIKRGNFDVGEDFKLASGGIQVGSDHGGAIRDDRIYNAVPVNDSETGVLNVFRLYDYSISEAQAEAISAAYPYISQGGLYTRTLVCDGNFSEDEAWAKDGEEGAYSLPQGAEVDGVLYNPSATLDVQSEATLAVNANVVLDTFTVGGDAAVNFAKVSGYSATVGGAAVINSPVMIEYGALNISGAPLQLGSAGSICFDCSKIDVSGIYAVTHIQLTGIVTQDDAKIAVILPVDQARRSELNYNTASQCYELLVTPLRDYVVAGNLNDSLEVGADTVVVGEGGFKLDSLSIPGNGRLEIDPVKSPIYITQAPVFAEGAKIVLSSNYSGVTLGRIVLMTWSGDAELPEDLTALFDSSSVASEADVSLTIETAPNDSAKQLVLTVGDYTRDAKEIRITSIGDSITQGVSGGSYGNPQYRTEIAARLAANGYKPKMLGIWKRSNWDSAGILQREDWSWHSGISGDRIITGNGRGGVRDNIYAFLDIAGDVNAITLLIGTNDFGAGSEVDDVYAAYKNTLFEAARIRPNAKIFGSTILDRNDGDDAADKRAKIAEFNARLRADYEEGNLPNGFVMLDLFEKVPVTYGQNGNFSTDALHLNWVGCSRIAEAFADAIMAALPLSGENAITGSLDSTVTNEPQTALGAESTVPQEYRSGMQKIFAIDSNQSINDFSGCAPYTTTNVVVSVNRQVTKAGYYMELVRKGTNRRKYVWVDFDATGKTLDEIDFPWSGANMDFVLEKLHVYSNDPSVHIVEANDDSVIGVVEGTHYNYSNGADATDERIPGDVLDYGWNDTLGSSGGYGGFQVHRLFAQTGSNIHWNNAEVLFAWNAWGSSKKDVLDDIGIGTFAKSGTLGGSSSMDYTFMGEMADGAADMMSASAYQVVHFEVWANVVIPENLVHGKWIGGVDNKMSTAGNWDNNRVPAKGEALDFTAAVSGEVVEADLDVEFASIEMGSELVTFTGNLATKAIINAEKVAVGQDSTVTVNGDFHVDREKEFEGDKVCIVGKIGEGGKFVVTGVLHIDVGDVNPTVHTSSGCLVVNSLKLNVEHHTNLYSTKDGAAQKWVIGNGGISGVGGIWCRSNSNNDSIFQPNTSDFTVDAWTVVREAVDSHKLLTTGFGDALPHVITLNGGFSDNGKVIVAGTGKVVVNHVTEAYGGKEAYSGAVSVTDTATLAINAGKKLTSGEITIASGAAFEVAQSGTVDLGGNLMLQDGAILAFNFSRATTPSLNINGKTLTAPSTVKIRISSKEKVHPRGGLHLLTTGGGFAGKTLAPADGEYPKWVNSISVNDDGNIVADMEPAGFCISIR